MHSLNFQQVNEQRGEYINLLNDKRENSKQRVEMFK